MPKTAQPHGEEATWNPPTIAFRIERHGGTVNGSSRAELQRWTVDVDKVAATCEAVCHRQLQPMQSRLNVESLAEEIVNAILSGKEDDRLQWGKEGSVRVLVGRILANGSAAKQTLAGRRKQFRRALVEGLEAKAGPSGRRLIHFT